MTENFHDSIAVSRVHGSPDIFTTFTYDPNWPEIVEGLEHGQQAINEANFAAQVYQMKLLGYLQEIKTGKVFGPVVVGNVASVFPSFSFLFLVRASYFSYFSLALLFFSPPLRGVPEEESAPCTYPCLAEKR